MYLIYLDEAGNTGSRLDDPDQPIHVVGAIIIADKDWLAIEEVFNGLVARLIPKKLERRGFEFHAADLFFGHGFFEAWSNDDRNGLVNEVLDIVTGNKLPIIYGAVNKPEFQKKYRRPSAPHDVAFLFAAERVERWFKKEAGDAVGMFIADETKADKDMKASLPQYRELISFGGRGDRLEHIIETIHFAASTETYGIQLADLVSYLIKRKLMGKANTMRFYERIEPLIYDARVFPP
jgi:hypothetical protein